MKSVFMTTIVGDDRPDIINSLAHKTRFLGGEWIKSKVIRLDGQFAAIMKVAVDEEKAVTLKADLDQAFSDLSISYAEVRTIQPGNTVLFNLVLDCDDRPGLTKDITKVLYDLDLRPENLEVSRLPLYDIGKTVYSAKMTVGVPDFLSKEELRTSLMIIGDNCRVNFY